MEFYIPGTDLQLQTCLQVHFVPALVVPNLTWTAVSAVLSLLVSYEISQPMKQ